MSTTPGPDPALTTESPGDAPAESPSPGRRLWRRWLAARIPVAWAAGAVILVAAVAGVGLASSRSDLDDSEAALSTAGAQRDALDDKVGQLESDVADAERAASRAEARRDDAIDSAKTAEADAKAKAEAALAPKAAELDQREAAVAAREAAVTQAEVERDQNTFGNGVWEVGVDIQPGKYKTAGSSDCYWAKLDSSGDIIDNDLPSGPTTVIIESSVFTFSSQDCGEWTKVG